MIRTMLALLLLAPFGGQPQLDRGISAPRLHQPGLETEEIGEVDEAVEGIGARRGLLVPAVGESGCGVRIGHGGGRWRRRRLHLPPP